MNYNQSSLGQTNNGKVPTKDNGIEIRKTICDICTPRMPCGIDAYVKDGVVIKVEGSKENPQNAGTLCVKGSANRQYIYHRDRIRTPLLRKGEKGSGQFDPISWDEALDIVTDHLQGIKEESGPESIIFYVGYPKWMRPFVKRLAHSFGSPNYCTESSVCATAPMVAANLNYGSFGSPDLKKAKCLLVWSSNPFHSNAPAVRKLLDARENGLKIIEVGPLLTPLTQHADVHLRIRPGTSGALAHGMANVIISEGLFDRGFIENWTLGFEEYREYVRGFTPEATEDITGVPATLIIKAARLYANSKPAALMPSASPTTHHTNGVQNHRALTALVGLTGNFDQEGGNYVVPPNYLYLNNGVATRQREFEQSRPFSEMAPRVGYNRHPIWCDITGQAQSMHIPFQIVSQSPYPVRAMLAFGLNYRMWPGSDFMREKLKMLDFLVDIDLFMTDSAKMADLVLPACSSFERSELKFYNQPYAIWTEPVIQPLGESRSDVDIIFDLAPGLAPDDVLFRAGYEKSLDWIMEPANLKIADLKKHPGGRSIDEVQLPPYRKYEKSGFHTPSGKMEFTSMTLKEAGLDPLPKYEEPKLSPRSTPEVAKEFPLILTTGARLPMFIHSRTFRVPWLRRLRPDPMVDMNPRDADERGIFSGDWVELSTPRRSIRVKANLTEIVPPGVVNMLYGYPQADVNELIEPDYLDPISGFPGFKSLLCQVNKQSE